MMMARMLIIGVGAGALGAAALLSGPTNSQIANPLRTAFADVKPVAFSYSEIFPWIAGSAQAGTTGSAAVAAAVDGAAVAAAAALQSSNTLGPLALTLNSIRSFSEVPGSPRATTNYTNMDEWSGGIAGLASSRGALGFADNAERYDPYVANHAGVLQMANTFGPAFFDLNVLKAIGFFQAPSGAVLASGYPDNISAVDIGRWNAGIPGVITNSGTTGFVTYQDDGLGYRADHWEGGLHTTTRIGPATFDVNVLPFVSVGLLPPAFAVGLTPDMTAEDTPFAPLSPPDPGIVQPNGGLSVPAPVPAVAPFSASPVSIAEVDAVDVNGPTPADPDETSNTQIQAARLNEEPKAIIPGVNGAPLSKAPRIGTTNGGGASSFDPWRPLQTFNDAVQSGLGAINGSKPSMAGDTGSVGSDSGGE